MAEAEHGHLWTIAVGIICGAYGCGQTVPLSQGPTERLYCSERCRRRAARRRERWRRRAEDGWQGPVHT